MPTSYKILGQAAPADTNNADLYTVPSATESVTSTIAIANTTASSSTARVFVRNNGATAAASNAIIFDTAVPGNSTITLTLGITLDATDVITVRSSTANALIFHAFGNEIS
jgi:predicted amidohydrolase